ncbi:MAG: hypothetical protein ACREMP_05515 [Candidatus Tyrphobacter sp.]
MLSTSKAVAVIAFCALGASLGGCTQMDVNSRSIRGIAYVRMDDVVKRDPLYGELSQIDDAIAVVTLRAAGPRVPRSAAEIAHEEARLRAQVLAAKARTQRIIASRQFEYQKRERDAVAAALRAAGVAGAGNVAGALGGTSAAQARQAQIAAGRDFGAFEQSVSQQSRTAATAIVRQFQAEAEQRLRAKALAEQQTETNLSLRLSQRDAAKKLAISTKLSMLALDQATHRRLQAQLDAMTRQENAALDAQRAADRRQFDAYRVQVAAQTNERIRAALQNIDVQTRAKVVGEQNTLRGRFGTQLQAPGASIHLTPATRAQIARIEQQFEDEYRNDVQGVVANYAATSDALEAEDAMLHGADAAAAGATQEEIAILQQRRQTLYDEIVARIQREAVRLAKAKGFRVVFSDVTAASGGYDMTNDLIHDIESEHE